MGKSPSSFSLHHPVAFRQFSVSPTCLLECLKSLLQPPTAKTFQKNTHFFCAFRKTLYLCQDKLSAQKGDKGSDFHRRQAHQFFLRTHP